MQCNFCEKLGHLDLIQQSQGSKFIKIHRKYNKIPKKYTLEEFYSLRNILARFYDE